MQSIKLPKKSIKYLEILFQTNKSENPGFEITFDTFNIGYDAREHSWPGSWAVILHNLPGTWNRPRIWH
jgi:hypothetical protein